MKYTESSFSVELFSRDHLKGLILNGNREKGLSLSGILGVIRDIGFHDDSIIITGDNGVIRLDLAPETLKSMLNRV